MFAPPVTHHTQGYHTRRGLVLHGGCSPIPVSLLYIIYRNQPEHTCQHANSRNLTRSQHAAGGHSITNLGGYSCNSASSRFRSFVSSSLAGTTAEARVITRQNMTCRRIRQPSYASCGLVLYIPCEVVGPNISQKGHLRTRILRLLKLSALEQIQVRIKLRHCWIFIDTILVSADVRLYSGRIRVRSSPIHSSGVVHKL